MRFINLTPHTINIRRIDGTFFTLPSEGVVRVETKVSHFMEIEGVAFNRALYGEVTGMPTRIERGAVYIVSAMAKSAFSQALDEEYGEDGEEEVHVTSPGELLRDGEGKPIGCDGLFLDV